MVDVECNICFEEESIPFVGEHSVFRVVAATTYSKREESFTLTVVSQLGWTPIDPAISHQTSINLPAKYMAPNHHKPFLHLHQSHKIESIYMPRRSNLHEIHVEEVMNGWPNGLRIIIIIHSIQVPRKNRR